MRTDNILLAISATILVAALILAAAAFLILGIGSPNLPSFFALP